MRNKAALPILFICLLIMAMPGGLLYSQQHYAPGENSVGEFEITVRNDPKRTIKVDELILDRDMDKQLNELYKPQKPKKYLYRTEKSGTETSGYLGFEESEWVEEIKFNVFNADVKERPLYKEFAELLADITSRIWLMKQTLMAYYQPALKLINICGDRRYGSLEAIEANIRDQLTVYDSLEELRKKVLTSVNSFTEISVCKDMSSDYQKLLDNYSRVLKDLSDNYESLKKKADALTKKMQPTSRKSPDPLR